MARTYVANTINYIAYATLDLLPLIRGALFSILSFPFRFVDNTNGHSSGHAHVTFLNALEVC